MINTKPTATDILMETQARNCRDAAHAIFEALRDGATVLGLDKNHAKTGHAVLAFADDDSISTVTADPILQLARSIRAEHVSEQLEEIMLAVENCDLNARKRVANAVRKLQ